MTMTIRTVVACLALAAIGTAAAQSDPQEEAASKARRKENAIAELSTLLRGIAIGRAMDPAVLYGARICALQYQRTLFEDGLELERRNARASGVIDLREARDQGEAIVSIDDEIKQVRADAKAQKVTPAKCSSKQVQRLNSCEEANAACRVFRLEFDGDDVLLYSLKKDAGEKQGTTIRDTLREKAPNALATVEADVIAALTLAGVDVEPVKAWFAAGPAPSAAGGEASAEATASPN